MMIMRSIAQMIWGKDNCPAIYSLFSASIDAARSWLGGGTLQPLTPSPCAAAAMKAAKGNSHSMHKLQQRFCM
jgi:hypothetical protein